MMEQHLWGFGTLVREASFYVLYVTRCHIYCRFDTDDMIFASTLI